MLTQKCPTFLRPLQRRVSQLSGAIASALMSVLAMGAQTPAPDQSRASSPPLTQIQDAQDTTAGVAASGVVRDSTGVGIEKAQAEFKSLKTGRVTTAVTQSQGRYQLLLPAGDYNVRIYAPGFSTFTRRVILKTARPIQLDATLSLGLTGEVVMVEPAPAHPSRRL